MNLLRNLLLLILTVSASILIGQERKAGKWENINLAPAAGRVVDIELHPTNPNKLYAVPDANGVWLTEDLGRNWHCISNTIPEVEHRICNGDIMVDPDNFDKIFFISQKGAMYISENAGKSWTRTKDKKGQPLKLTDFKRSLITKDKSGKITMICTTIGRKHGKKSDWKAGLHVSKDEGQTWKHFPNPSKEEEFLEIAVHPTNPNIIYAPTTHRIYKSENGGESFEAIFNFTTQGNPSSVAVVDSKPDWVYVIACEKPSVKNKKGKKTKAKTSLYKSKDAGKTWEVIQDMSKGTGYDKSVFAGGFTGSWLNNFAVNPNNPEQMMTAEVNMCESEDEGKTWKKINWWERSQAIMNNGGMAEYHKYARHIADNQCLKYHKACENRLFKACDAGLYVRDPEIGFKNWVSIGGKMQGWLFYSVKVNEFGDRYLISNTQDVDLQTYQYNKWQTVRGYEGDFVFIYPYSNFAYFPYCRCAAADSIKGMGKGFRSWGRPQTAVNYRKPNEGFILYKNKINKKNLKRVYFTSDKGKTAKLTEIPTQKSICYINIARSNGRITAVSNDSLFFSSDNTKTWQTKKAPAKNITFAAVNPDNPDNFWLSSKDGKVYETTDGGISWNSLSTGLPKDKIEKILFHEGTKRDLYVLTKNKGIYYLSGKSIKWEKWMDGFYLPEFSDMIIDYPKQKLLASSYGSGLWQADLQNPCERFLTKGVKIKEISDYNGYKTFAVDNPYFTPQYYNYRWKVNGIIKGYNSAEFVSKKIKKGDIVSCDMEVRESVDLKIDVKDYKVETEIQSTKVKNKKNSLISEGSSLDLGYIDFFNPYMDFSIDFWVKAEGDGVIIANRRHLDHDAKGWLIGIKGKELYVKYSIKTNTAEIKSSSPKPTKRLKGKIKLKRWVHVALVVNRDKEVRLYINGEKVDEKNINLEESGISLNSIFNTFIFSDVTGEKQMKGAIDELRIWQKSLKKEEVKKAAEKELNKTKNLRLYYSFDDEENREFFTGRAVIIKGKVKKSK